MVSRAALITGARPADGSQQLRKPERVGWPSDPVVSERRRWVAHYAGQNWPAGRINNALRKHLPKAQWVSDTTVESDLRWLIKYHRSRALADTETIVTRLSTRLEEVAVTALEEFRQSLVPRRIKVGEGNGEEVVIPAASQSERTALLNTIIRATAAQQMLHLGAKGGVTVNVNNNTLNVSAQPSQESQDIRAIAADVRRQIQAERRPARRRDTQDVIDIVAERTVDGSLADEMDALVRGDGLTGSTNEADDWGQD